MIVNLASTDHKQFVANWISSIEHRFGPRWPELFFDIGSLKDEEYAVTIGTVVLDDVKAFTGHSMAKITMACTSKITGYKLVPRKWNHYLKISGTSILAAQVQRELQKSIAHAAKQGGRLLHHAAKQGSVHYIASAMQQVHLWIYSRLNIGAIVERAAKNGIRSLGAVSELMADNVATARDVCYVDHVLGGKLQRLFDELKAEAAIVRVRSASEQAEPVVVDLPVVAVQPDEIKGLPLNKNVTDEGEAVAYNKFLGRVTDQLEKDAAEYMAMKTAERTVTGNDTLRAELRGHMALICKKWMNVTGGSSVYVAEALVQIVTERQ